MAGHPDPDVLADFREGLLSRRRSAQIRAHLDRCSQCTALDRELAEVTELLASAPAPRMPDDLVTRLENVLAAEVAARAENSRTAGQSTGDAGTSPDGDRGRHGARTGGRSWRWQPAMLGAAAAVALVLALVGYGLARLTTHGISSSSNAAAGNAVPAGPEKSVASGRPTPQAEQFQVIRSGTDYLPGRLASQVSAVLARHPLMGTEGNALPSSANEPQHSPSDTLGGVASSLSRVQSCVMLITGGLQPLLVDEAHYQGRPATIIVLAPTGGLPGQVWVAGPGCSAANHDLLAHTQLPASG